MDVQVLVTDEATKDLEGIRNAVIIKRLFKLIERLKAWPNVSGVKPLTGALAGRYRMRTGDYRLQFYVARETVKAKEQATVKGKVVTAEREGRQTKVVVEKVGHRDGFYDD